MRELLAHRLSPVSSSEAKREWYEIVEGDHDLWRGVSEPYKHTIRAFLVHFNTEIQRSSTERFNFRNGSVGTLREASLAAQDRLGVAGAQSGDGGMAGDS